MNDKGLRTWFEFEEKMCDNCSREVAVRNNLFTSKLEVHYPFLCVIVAYPGSLPYLQYSTGLSP
jgi:hypothetical protein